MDILIIEGGHPLKGTIEISGAKNAALPILFATILTDQKCTLTNVPTLMDIQTTKELLGGMGSEVSHDLSQHCIEIQSKKLNHLEASYDLVRTMRASILMLGPTIARFGKAKVSLPGGCSIGARPVNLHLMALEKMGAKVTLEEGYILAEAKKLQGADITFNQVTVTGTENALMAATLAKGVTILRNAAQEPEVVDLAYFLKKCGAHIQGEGTPTITIEGVKTLSGCTHSIIPDRIEAGTYMVAAAITGGELFLPKIPLSILGAVVNKLLDCGIKVVANNSGIHVKSEGIPHATDVATMPFPGFPTDMQAQFMALMAISDGVSMITENIFENRFMHVAELLRLGADITVQGHTAAVKGCNSKNVSTKSSPQTHGQLVGATVMATDLRASACLVLAGLAAQGKTIIRRIYHLDRGYEKMELKLAKVGAQILREKEERTQ